MSDDRRTGRPTKLTAEVMRSILVDLERGASLSGAAQAAGIHERTLRRWLADGAQDHASPELATFAHDVAQALAKAERAAVAVVVGAFDKDHRAAMWWLERARPKEWGPRREPDGTSDQTSAASTHEWWKKRPEPAASAGWTPKRLLAWLEAGGLEELRQRAAEEENASSGGQPS